MSRSAATPRGSPGLHGALRATHMGWAGSWVHRPISSSFGVGNIRLGRAAMTIARRWVGAPGRSPPTTPGGVAKWIRLYAINTLSILKPLGYLIRDWFNGCLKIAKVCGDAALFGRCFTNKCAPGAEGWAATGVCIRIVEPGVKWAHTFVFLTPFTNTFLCLINVRASNIERTTPVL